MEILERIVWKGWENHTLLWLIWSTFIPRLHGVMAIEGGRAGSCLIVINAPKAQGIKAVLGMCLESCHSTCMSCHKTLVHFRLLYVISHGSLIWNLWILVHDVFYHLSGSVKSTQIRSIWLHDTPAWVHRPFIRAWASAFPSPSLQWWHTSLATFAILDLFTSWILTKYQHLHWNSFSVILHITEEPYKEVS